MSKLFSPVPMSSWPQRQVYNMFRNYKDPYFEVCLQLEISRVHHFARANHISLYFCLCYLCTKAANMLPNWHYRFYKKHPVYYYTLNPSCTDKRPQETAFHFVNGMYNPNKDMVSFVKEITDLSRCKDSFLIRHPQDDPNSHIYFTSLPWLPFTSMVNLHPNGKYNGCPSIAFGKYQWQNDQLLMPISIQVNHLLLNGEDVGEFYQTLQQLIGQLS